MTNLTFFKRSTLEARNNFLIQAFCIIYIFFAFGVSLIYYNRGYYDFSDLLFDTDPDTYIGMFAHGRGRIAISHPFLGIFYFIIRLFELTLSSSAIITDSIRFRELSALLISPIFSALTILYFYKILKQLNLGVNDSVLLTVLFAMSFSNILFSIVPETYAISCFLISALINFQLKCREKNEAGNPLIWGFIAMSMTGITITNIMIFIIVYFIHCYYSLHYKLNTSIKKATLVAGVSLLTVLVTFYVVLWLFKIPQDFDGSREWISIYFAILPYHNASALINLFSATINALSGLFPNTFPYMDYYNEGWNSLTFLRNRFDIPWLIFVGAIYIFLGKQFWMKRQDYKDDVFIYSILIIAYNFILHTFFGKERFLYTQHWIVPAFLILIPLLKDKPKLSIILIFFFSLVNLTLLYRIDSYLRIW